MQFLASEEAHVQLPIEPFYYGVITMVIFVVLGLITWSYRDVANRHEHKNSNSKGHH
jgi:hypothetical protein